MRVYDSLHLTYKVIIKEQVTQWYVASLNKGNKETVDLGLPLSNPFMRIILCRLSTEY